MPWLSPFSLILLGLLVLLPALFARRRWLGAIGGLLLVSGLLLATPIGANALVALLERDVDRQAHACEQLDAVVLLAGGVQRAPQHASDFDALSEHSLARVFGFLERSPSADVPLLVSGGGPFAISEAKLIAELLHRLDAPAPSWLDTRSRTTWESAREARARLPSDVRRIALATSALHLPRARLVFEQAGFAVCPWPLDHRFIDATGVGAWWPQSSALRKSEAALHELVGIAHYRLRMRWPGTHTPPLQSSGISGLTTSAPAAAIAAAAE